MNYKTCEEYVLATLEALKQELNRTKADYAQARQNIDKQLELDKELIEQKNEDIKYLVELINNLCLVLCKNYSSVPASEIKDIQATSKISIDPNSDLYKYLSNNINRLGIKITKKE